MRVHCVCTGRFYYEMNCSGLFDSLSAIQVSDGPEDFVGFLSLTKI